METYNAISTISGTQHRFIIYGSISKVDVSSYTSIIVNNGHLCFLKNIGFL